MVLQVGRSTSTGKSSEARSANGLKWSRVSSQARIKIPCPAQPAALTTIPRWQPLAAQPRWAGTTPRPPAVMPQKAPASPADALMTSVAQRRHPCGGNGLKSTRKGFSNGLSLRQSRSRRSHSIRQSAAEPAGRRPEVKKHHQPGGKTSIHPQCPSSSIPRRQSLAGTHWGRIVSDASGAAPEGMR